jgi:multimeric flavodoxin WrbA
MKFFIINSSPRKNQNTSKLLDKVVEGITDTLNDKTEDVEIEMLNLYDLNYTG